MPPILRGSWGGWVALGAAVRALFGALSLPLPLRLGPISDSSGRQCEFPTYPSRVQRRIGTSKCLKTEGALMS